MRTAPRRTFVALIFVLATACSQGPQPSHVSGAYRGKLEDDTMVEAATTLLVTKRDIVIALDCAPLAEAVARQDAGRIDQAVANGAAVRLPAGVTIYTPPFSPANRRTMPFVVTDDKYGGRLCTPDSYDVLKE